MAWRGSRSFAAMKLCQALAIVVGDAHELEAHAGVAFTLAVARDPNDLAARRLMPIPSGSGMTTSSWSPSSSSRLGAEEDATDAQVEALEDELNNDLCVVAGGEGADGRG